MTLAAGSKLGPYEILSPLGAGGMGEVYRARDARLGRDVALKMLPPELGRDAERLARLDQEARSASALNHPNIVTIYEVGEADAISYIAMEYIQGRSLRDILSEGPVAPRRLLGYAAQIAEALARAHEAGIVHRDLKPENLMVTRDGYVKILDFGLAKVVAPASSEVSQLATAVGPTGPGVVLGTVGYMSPEQAAGRRADYRSDQFSFGSILYEMVTGRRAFQRDTGVETLSAIIREDPKPIAEITPDAPAPVKWIAERCLEKDPEERYASTRDLARELASVRDHLSEVSRSGEAAAAAGAPRKNRRFGWVVAALAGLVAGCLTGWSLRRPPAPSEPTAVRFLTYSGDDLSPAVSPDGRTVAFSSTRDGRPRIWLKQLAGGGEVPLTEGPDDSPRFSPDGSQVLFARIQQGSNALYRISVLGGEARKIIDDGVEADWSYDGSRIAFLRFDLDKTRARSLLWIVSADGSQARQIAAIPDRQLNHPRWSPDDKVVALSEVAAGGATKSFFLVDVGSGDVREISTGEPGLASALAWTKTPNEAVYSISESAVAAVTGSAAAVMLLDVKTGRKRPLFWSPMNADVLDVMGPGTVVYDVRSVKENIQELRLTGHAAVEEPVWVTHGNSSDRQPTYSPDGEWLLFSSTRSGNQDLWMMSTKTGALRRLTDDPGEDWDPAFTPDGRMILWSSNRSGAFEIWAANADGTNVRQITREDHDAENPNGTPDGKWIVFNQGSGPNRGIRKIRPDGSGAEQILSGTTVLPDVSPDGQYVSFRLNLRVELFGLRVARISDGSIVSKFEMDLPQRRGFTGNSIARSRWMPDGKAIVFVGQDEKGVYGLYIQEFDPNRDTSATRRPLAGFDPSIATETMGISPDGTRLAFAGPEQASSLMFAERVPGVDRPTRK